MKCRPRTICRSGRPLSPTITATGDDSAFATETGGATGQTRRFYRTQCTSLSAYDKTGFAGTYFTSTAPVGGGANTVTPNNGARGHDSERGH